MALKLLDLVIRKGDARVLEWGLAGSGRDS